jgi:hypothetical protein
MLPEGDLATPETLRSDTMTSPPSVSIASGQPVRHLSLTPVHGVRPQASLNFNRDDWGVDIWRSLRAQATKPREHPSIYWCTSEDYIKKRAVALPPPPPPFDASSWSFVPEMDPTTMQFKQCHLLSLPKELRLEIWRHVLTDPSIPKVSVGITRALFSPGKTSLRFPNPCLITTIPRKSRVRIDILSTNRFIYEEALPVLYHSLQFAALDLDGIFDPFLKTISSFARSHIRYVKLRTPAAIHEPQLFGGSPSTYLVNWAITCAQVAKLPNVREVEVEGYPTLWSSERVKTGILNPLCKIKARKVFSAEVNDEAQMALGDAERALRSHAQIRRQRTVSEAAERAERDILAAKERAREEERRSRTYSLPTLPPPLSSSAIDRDISQIPGIRHFEEELREHESSNSVFDDVEEGEVDLDTGEWEIVSLKNEDCTPKKIEEGGSGEEEGSDTESWTDTASTLVKVKSWES